ncbi:MAG: PKD domain-containing protein, partial [Chlorobi bacterium]|nr:PKD domain-containing protein [Chlorobiota bacterium]
YWFDDPQLTNNIGSGGTQTPGSAVGTVVYYVVDSLGGCSSAPMSVQITVNALPTTQNIVGGGDYCLGGTGRVITTQNSEKNVNYQLFVDGSQIGAPLPGSSSGDPVSFGYQTTAGTYTVVATSSTTGCYNNMNNSVAVTIDPLPNIYNVIGTGADCYGGPGVAVQLSGSETGINYQLYINENSEVGTPVAGSGSSFSFGNMTEAGDYTVVATNASTGCVSDMNLTGTVTIYDLPEKFDMYQTDSYCSGGAGVEVGISGSETGVTYQLYRDNTILGIPKNGDGQPISFGYQTDSATYTVIATNTYSCKDTMNGNAVIAIDPLPTPYTLDFVTGGSYCADGNGVELALDNSDTGVEYQLYLGGNATGSPVPGVNGTLSFGLLTAGSYTAVATNATTGCIENMLGNPSISINPLPTIYDVSGGGAYCNGGTGAQVELANSESGITYQFLHDGVEVSTLNGVNGSALSQTFTEAGIYTIHAINNTTTCEQDMNGSATITINELPAVYNVTPVDGYYCSGDENGVAISLDNSEANVKYDLYRIGVLIETKIGTGATFNFTGQTTTGTYNVVATNNDNCTENMTGTSTVHVNPLPAGVINSTLNPSNGCTPLDAQFTFVQSNTVVIDTFIWNYDDGTIDTTNATITTVSHIYNNNYNSTITPDFSVSAISSDGCIFTTTQTIDIYPEVVAGFNVLDTAGCSRFDVSFMNTSQGNQPSYSWSFGNEGTSSERDPSHGFTYSRDTSVLVTLIAESADFCKDTTSQLIYVYESPLAEFSVQEESITAPDSIHLINLTVESNDPAGWNYTWDFYDGGSSTATDPTHFYEWAGYYDITLTAYDNECSDDYTLTYVVQARNPEVYPLFDSAGCVPFTIKFPDSTKYARNWEWNFGDGYTSTSKEPTHLFDQPGTYFVRLKALAPDVDGNNIYDQATVSEITVYAKPYVEFQFDKYLVFIYTDSVIFTNRSDDLDYVYNWRFGDGETSNEINPSHIYQVEGTYQVELHATNSNGCVDSVKHGDIVASEAEKLYFPTVFFPIPGGEPDNNVSSERNTSLFYPLVGTGVSEEGYEFSIYDRWGELVFQTKELHKGWTGYKEGVLLKQGVYVWIVKGKYDNGDPFGPETGNVTLLR